MHRAFKFESNDFMAVVNQASIPAQPDRFNTAINEAFASVRQGNIRRKLSEMIKCPSNSISAEVIWDDWFPEIKADVFISHSSKDVELAKQLSAWLQSNFKLTPFIDSEIWGHSDELLKEIDREYCLNPGGETYCYEKRNGSTAHVHMMLSYALTRRIDKSECFIFLESGNSVTAEGAVEGTYSPWIFHELAMADTIELKPTGRGITKTASAVSRLFSEAVELKIKYPLLGKRMRRLDSAIFRTWLEKNKYIQGHALDLLYSLLP